LEANKPAPAPAAAPPQASAQRASTPSARPMPMPGPPPPITDEMYIGQVLNNRFKIESKIGEGGFGSVFRGVQTGTGRKVALKLLHPEMTKDVNLVARFKREGMVLCNLRDAHTITTYDFDQTADGTLYIAMELLEGKSLHHIFHEQAPLEWKRVFKIMIEMCSSLAEAHGQGIVHRDLKPENIYLENRPGNPEFVKILDFGIAKIQRGDSIDPQSPQLTATGQTLGTLEYMSPEQLMGKQLDGRSDVYALGVVGYEMITGRLPFPDAKGPAGLITAQLKQTPKPPSTVLPTAGLPPGGDQVLLKALEKDKNNRHADVTAMAAALQDVLDRAKEASSPAMMPPVAASASSPAMPPAAANPSVMSEMRNELSQHLGAAPEMPPAGGAPLGVKINTPQPGSPPANPQASLTPTSYPQAPAPSVAPAPATQYPQASPNMYPQGVQQRARPAKKSVNWVWWVVLLAFGAAAGAVLALVLRHT
jgi:serine/threonine-protein kinase